MSIKKNFAYNLILNVANVIFPLITAPYISRVLDPKDIGLFNFAVTLSGYFALVAALGTPAYGIREIARHKDSDDLQQVFSQIFSITVYSTAIVTGIYLVALLLVNQLRESFFFFLLSGVVLYLKPFSIEWLYQGIEKFSFLTLRSIIIKTLSVALMFCFVKTKGDLFVYLLIFVLCQCTNQIWNTVRLKKIGLSIKMTTAGLKRHLKPISLLFVSALAVSIYTVLDSIMLGFISGYTDVAYYTHANNIIKLLVSLVTSLAIVTMPKVSQMSDGNRWPEINEVFKKSVSLISFLVFPMCVATFAISSVFVPLFYGNAFMGTIIPLEILSMLIIIMGFSNLTGLQILVPLGKDKYYLVSVLSGTVSNLVLNLILIPEYGAVGASLSSVISEVLVLLCMFYFIYRKTEIRLTDVGDSLKALLGAAFLIPVYILAKKYLSGWIVVLVFTISGSAVYLLIETLMRNKSVLIFFNTALNAFRNLRREA